MTSDFDTDFKRYCNVLEGKEDTNEMQLIRFRLNNLFPKKWRFRKQMF